MEEYLTVLEDKPSEECGIFGIYDYGMLPKGDDRIGVKSQELDCARLTFYGLFALQHRGQHLCRRGRAL